MIEIRGRNLREIIQKIPNSPEERVYISLPLSKELVLVLLHRMPNLRVVYLPPSAIKRTPKKILNALNGVGVTVIPMPRRGRPRRDRAAVFKLAEEGKSPREISELLNIPLRTVYHILQEHSASQQPA